MRSKLSVALSLLAAMTLPASCLARQSAAVPHAAINPMYTASPDSLSDAQVADLQHQLADWPQLARYRDDNAALPAPVSGHPRVVFYGDSITDAWGRADGTTFFPGRSYLNRGISGQTTAQMLLRFRQDVIDLHPAVVVILAGTNDIAGNTGLATPAMIEDNMRSMTELAQAHHIHVILASILPTTEYPWHPGLQPAGTIRQLNAWLKHYAKEHGAVWLDYYDALANAEGGMDKRLAADGVHPTPAGYAIMAPLAQQAIDKALAN